jgi:cellulose synthase/poly-beta-1,6-N-acetylglucosamine synthase-like glycosyltransferase
MVQREFARARLIANSENRGFCAANNQGFAATTTELVALLNNDAEAGPSWLQALLDALDRRPDCGMAASKILVWEDPSRIDKAGHLIYPDGQNRGRGSGEPDRGQYDGIEETLWPDGCAAMYRRRMLAEIGGFDEDLFAYADDAELGLRAQIAGWRCVYAPGAVVRHHRGATLGLRSTRRLELIERNRAAGGAIFLEPAVAEPGVLPGKDRVRRWAALSGRGETALYRARWANSRLRRLDPRRLPGSSAGSADAAQAEEIERIRKLAPQVRELILENGISSAGTQQPIHREWTPCRRLPRLRRDRCFTRSSPLPTACTTPPAISFK